MFTKLLFDRVRTMKEEAVKRLTRLARRALVVRKRLQGWSVREISNAFDVGYATVYRWTTEWEADVILYHEWLQLQFTKKTETPSSRSLYVLSRSCGATVFKE